MSIDETAAGRTGAGDDTAAGPLRRPRGDERRRAGATGAIPVGSSGVPGTADRTVPAARETGTPAGGVTGPIRQFLGPMTGSLRIGRGRPEGAPEQRLRVDWPQCKAHGLCAEIAPEIIHLDEWGYPVYDTGALSPDDLPNARKAMQVCPTLALRLTDVPGAR